MFKYRKLGPLTVCYVLYSREHLVSLTVGKRMLRVPLPMPGWQARQWAKLCWAALSLRVWPVYAQLWQRDCDQCEATSAHRYWTGAGYKRAVLDSYRHAEGPTRWTRLTRRQYLEHECDFRDRRAEQMGY